MAEPTHSRVVLRDQMRAARAYRVVDEVVNGSAHVEPRAYKNLVLAVGVDIRRLGLSGALAALERERGVGEVLIRHLEGAPMHSRPPDGQLAAWVRSLDLTRYMLVTRELIQYVVWLRRAVQALIKEP